jgi:hypothetical protein
MTKYLLDYLGGCKGDFLCNYINDNTLHFADTGILKSNSSHGGLKIDEERQKNYEFHLSKNLIILPGHKLYELSNTILKQFDCRIIKLNINKKFYNIAAIEFIIKHFASPIDKKILIKYHSSDIGKNFKTLKYMIDIVIYENNDVINNLNRINYLFKKLDNLHERFSKYDKINEFYDTVYKIVNYEDLYINKKYDFLFEIKPDFDPIHYENLLEKTWLPDIVNVFGYDLDLRKYGYRDY